MQNGASERGASPTTAVLVSMVASGPILCPFFGKCDGLILIDPQDKPEKLYKGIDPTAEALCDLIIKLRPQRLICGFIREPEKAKLRAAGIDVRLGSCTCAIDELVACFCDLPKA
jgi:hypothetical protein